MRCFLFPARRLRAQLAVFTEPCSAFAAADWATRVWLAWCRCLVRCRYLLAQGVAPKKNMCPFDQLALYDQLGPDGWQAYMAKAPLLRVFVSSVRWFHLGVVRVRVFSCHAC